MIAYYVQIKAFHVVLALCSGGLFALRAIGTTAGGGWPMAAPVRYASYAIDTGLLTAALMLMTVTHQYPFVQSWLTVKVALVVVYIVLGSLALKRGRTRRIRIGCSLAAAATFLLIIAIARAHSPWGPLARFL